MAQARPGICIGYARNSDLEGIQIRDKTTYAEKRDTRNRCGPAYRREKTKSYRINCVSLNL